MDPCLASRRPSMNEFNGNSKPQVQLKGWLVEDIDL